MYVHSAKPLVERHAARFTKSASMPSVWTAADLACPGASVVQADLAVLVCKISVSHSILPVARVDMLYCQVINVAPHVPGSDLIIFRLTLLDQAN